MCIRDRYGFVEAPYRKVKKTYDENGKLIDQVVTDEVEDVYKRQPVRGATMFSAAT